MDKESGRVQPLALRVPQLDHAVAGLQAADRQAVLGNGLVGTAFIVENAKHHQGQLWTCDGELHRLVPLRVESVVLHHLRFTRLLVIGNPVHFNLT